MPPSKRFSRSPSITTPSGVSPVNASATAGASARIGGIQGFAANLRAPAPDNSVAQALSSVANSLLTVDDIRRRRAEQEVQANYSAAAMKISEAVEEVRTKSTTELNQMVSENRWVPVDGDTPIKNRVTEALADDSQILAAIPEFQALPKDRKSQLLLQFRTQQNTLAMRAEEDARVRATTIRKNVNFDRLGRILGNTEFELSEETGAVVRPDGTPSGIRGVVNSIKQAYPVPEDSYRRIRNLYRDIVDTNLPDGKELQGVFHDSLLEEFKDENGDLLLNASDIADTRDLIQRREDRSKGPSINDKARGYDLRVMAERAYDSLNYFDDATLASESGRSALLNAVSADVALRDHIQSTGDGTWNEKDQLRLENNLLSYAAANEIAFNVENVSSENLLALKESGKFGAHTQNDILAVDYTATSEALDNETDSERRRYLSRKKELMTKMLATPDSLDANGRIQRSAVGEMLETNPSPENLIRVVQEAQLAGVPFIPWNEATLNASIDALEQIRRNPNTVDPETYGLAVGGVLSKITSNQRRLQVMFGHDVGEIDGSDPLTGAASKLSGDYGTLFLNSVPSGHGTKELSAAFKALEANTHTALYAGNEDYKVKYDDYSAKVRAGDVAGAELVLPEIKQTLRNSVLARVDRREIVTPAGTLYPRASESIGHSDSEIRALGTIGGNLAPLWFIPSEVAKARETFDVPFGMDPTMVDEGKIEAFISSVEDAPWPAQTRPLKDSLVQKLRQAQAANRSTKSILSTYDRFYRDTQSNSKLYTDAYGKFRLTSEVEGQRGPVSRGFSYDAIFQMGDERFAEVFEETIRVQEGGLNFFGYGGDFKAMGILDAPALFDESPEFQRLGISRELQPGDSYEDAIRRNIPMSDPDWSGEAKSLAGGALQYDYGPYRAIRATAPLSDNAGAVTQDRNPETAASGRGQDNAHLLTRSYASLFDQFVAQQFDAAGNLMPSSSYYNRVVQEGVERQVRPILRQASKDLAGQGAQIQMTVGSISAESNVYDPDAGFFSDATPRRRNLVGMTVDVLITDSNGSPIPEWASSYELPEGVNYDPETGILSYNIQDDDVKALYDRFIIKK